MATSLATRRSTTQRGFTLIEVLFSVLILGVLIGLLFVAFRTTRRYAASVTDRQAVNAVKMGVSRFIEECGIAPPLVRGPRDGHAPHGGDRRRRHGRLILRLRLLASADMAVLRDVTFPRRRTSIPSPTPATANARCRCISPAGASIRLGGGRRERSAHLTVSAGRASTRPRPTAPSTCPPRCVPEARPAAARAARRSSPCSTPARATCRWCRIPPTLNALNCSTARRCRCGSIAG
jgi:prepilin-type N-terminal cleavage/methylation domain-containing protein